MRRKEKIGLTVAGLLLFMAGAASGIIPGPEGSYPTGQLHQAEKVCAHAWVEAKTNGSYEVVGELCR